MIFYWADDWAYHIIAIRSVKARLATWAELKLFLLVYVFIYTVYTNIYIYTHTHTKYVPS